MPIVLRIDVDNGFLYDMGKIYSLLNHINENIVRIPLRILGYLKHLDTLFKTLDEIGYEASIFFKYTTLPLQYQIDYLKNNRYDIGLHVYSASDYRSFMREVQLITKNFNKTIMGFSKHGDGKIRTSLKHAWRYEPIKYIIWGLKSGLLYFTGNYHAPYTRVFSLIIKNRPYPFYYFPHVFYIEPYARKVKASIKDIIDYSSTGKIVVALIHPRNIVQYPNVRREFLRFIKYVDKTYSFKSLLKILSRKHVRIVHYW